MYHSLLVPLDGSIFGEYALPAALSIARRMGAALHLVHVHMDPALVNVEGVLIVDPSLDLEARQREQDYLESVVRRVRDTVNVPVTATLLEGYVPEAIHEHAVAGKVDLVVLTTHGRGPLSRFWLGSVADQLVRRLPMPMLLVRPQEKAPDFSHDVVFHRVLVPLDGTPFAEHVLPAATVLGGVAQTDYRLLRVVPPLLPGSYVLGDVPMSELTGARLTQLRAIQEGVEKEAAAYLERTAVRLCKQGLSTQTQVVCHDKPAIAILEEARQRGSDLIALATHGRRGLARLLLGSVTDKVLRGATMPLLIHHPLHP